MISGCIRKFRGQAPLPSHLLLFGTFEHLTEVEQLKKLGSESSTQTDVITTLIEELRTTSKWLIIPVMYTTKGTWNLF